MKVLVLVLIATAVLFAAFAAFTSPGRSLTRDLGDRVSQALFRGMQSRGLVLGISASGYSFPEGTRFFFSSTFGAPLSITGLSNADPALATSAAHGLADLDEILLNSGWEDATNAVYQVDQQDVNSFKVNGLFTSDTSFFPAGTGIGTAQKITNWQQIPKVLGISTSGGDPRYTTIQPLASRNALNIPTGFNPSSTTLQIAHNPSDTTFQAMVAISRKLQPVAFKLVLGGGGMSYGYGFMAVNENPSLNANQVNQVNVAFSFQGRQISY